MHATILAQRLVRSIPFYLLPELANTNYNLTEKPIHFGLLSLLINGVALLAYARYNGHSQASYVPLASEPLRTYSPRLDRILNRVPKLLLRLLPPTTPLAILVIGIVARVLVTWRVIRTIQCSWDGVAALLPLVVVVVGDIIDRGAQDIRRGRFDHVSDPAKLGRSFPSLLRYISFAVAWAWAATATFEMASLPTGAICPSGWRWGLLVPAAQLVIVFLDAFILHRIAHIKQDQDTRDTATRSIAAVSLASAASLMVLSAFSLHNLANFDWALRLDLVAIRDLLMDSILASTAFLSGIHMLSVLDTWTVAVTVSGILLHVQLWTRVLSLPLETEHDDIMMYVLGPLICIVLLIKFDKDARPLQRAGATVMQKILLALFAILAGLLLMAAHVVVKSPSGPASHKGHVVEGLVSSARDAFKAWESQAGNSTTLEEAIGQYSRRHGIPPPPNFDKWFEFATSYNSTIIDDFDQVYLDLKPFWGLPPSTIRERTSHLLEHPRLNMGGLRIRGGEVQLSPHTPGTHAWMMNANADMIRPYARWLPDMDLAFNLNDECRVAVPFEEMSRLHSEGEAARERLRRLQPEHLSGWTPSDQLSPAWSDRFMDKGDQSVDPGQRSPYFSDHIRRQIFYNHVSPACPPVSPARHHRWWDRKTSCISCAEPHMAAGLGGSYVSNWTLAGDLCHQVDLAYLDGFLSSPAPMVSTTTPFPVFSQGRVGGFADILVPSPWNFVQKSTYDDSLAIPWSEKRNGLFWRGGASDGFAADGAWQGFLRARFVHSALEFNRNRPRGSASKSSLDVTDVDVNVTFVGKFTKCDEGDCASERETFYRGGVTEGLDPGQSGSPASVPFSENWRYRHLIDLDGAGFSGRFIPFLQSYSLVYRAGLFRTWFDHRVHAWQHYIPLDVRLGNGLWRALDFFSGNKGGELGEQIALDGREWANKVLRPEDMQVYMFRLLLEWGRVVDDRREQLGHV